ncbi:MAG: acetyl-CoA carboxylase biotin carboxyl carrier protein [Leptolyngbyaceae cyanobacterium bins.349]|nr:acetyl-CoA carboxylase biotin carboxyl carrier protein [Leptolyngbyaceae cyanobacterium bins.349]
MPLNLNELRELLEAINQMDIAELTLKSDDFELTVRRGGRIDEQLLAASIGRLPSPEGMAIAPQPTAPIGSHTTELRSVTETPPAATPSALPPTNERRWVEILSPMVGTFYRSPAPDEPPFIDIGERVRVGQTVCIIEAMKLMNEIEAEVSGEILEILVQNGEPVEYSQPLMRVAPS